jgi:hypothetical protein
MSRPHRHGLNVAPIGAPIPLGSYVRRLLDRSAVNYLTSRQEMLTSGRDNRIAICDTRETPTAHGPLVVHVGKCPVSIHRDVLRRQLIPFEGLRPRKAIDIGKLGWRSARRRHRSGLEAVLPCRVGVRSQLRSSTARLLRQGLGLERHPIKQDPAVDTALKCQVRCFRHARFRA